MQTLTELVGDDPQPAQVTHVATRARRNTRLRSLAFAAAMLIAPLAIGRGVSRLAGSRRAGAIAGAFSLAKLATLRWQLKRYFVDEPDYVTLRRIGELEIRRYPAHLEAHTRLTVPDFEIAMRQGFRRLFRYITGRNTATQRIAMTTPVLIKPRATTHTVAFVMPPGRTLLTLPRPSDDQVHLVHVPARRIAAIRFHGRYTDEALLEHSRQLHDLVEAAGLETRGQPMFAGFDPPWTLPWLRRTEMWIELA